MIHKNSYYDIPAVLGFEDMAAVRAAGIVNPSKVARRIISTKQVGAQKRRRGIFLNSMSAEVNQLLDSIRKKILHKAMVAKQKKSKRRFGAIRRRTPVQAPPVSVQESGGGEWGWIPNIFKRRKV